MSRVATGTVRGVPVLLERRRYGNTTYTWVEAKLNGAWVSLGDPWPCVVPAEAEVAAAILAVQAN